MRYLLLLAIIIWLPVEAQTPLRSAAWAGPTIQCGESPTAANADLMPLDALNHWETQNAHPGAGQWPDGYSTTIRKVCLSHVGNFQAGYAVVGHSGPNGDHVTPFVIGIGTLCMNYEADAPVVVTGGEYFDVHAGCSSGSHAIILQLWYKN